MQNLKENRHELSKITFFSLSNFHKLKNSDFILESEMTEIQIQNNQINQMLCENFILPWK